jgi:hypothetical protein
MMAFAAYLVRKSMELMILSLTLVAIALILNIDVAEPRQFVRVIDRDAERRLDRWMAERL